MSKSLSLCCETSPLYRVRTPGKSVARYRLKDKRLRGLAGLICTYTRHGATHYRRYEQLNEHITNLESALRQLSSLSSEISTTDFLRLSIWRIAGDEAVACIRAPVGSRSHSETKRLRERSLAHWKDLVAIRWELLKMDAVNGESSGEGRPSFVLMMVYGGT